MMLRCHFLHLCTDLGRKDNNNLHHLNTSRHQCSEWSCVCVRVCLPHVCEVLSSNRKHQKTDHSEVPQSPCHTYPPILCIEKFSSFIIFNLTLNSYYADLQG